MSLTRLWRALTIFGLLFAPLGIIGGHAAMAMPADTASTVMNHGQAGAPAGHCADIGQDQNGQTSPSIDCTIACSVMPAADFEIASHPAARGLVQVAALASLLRGLHPESDPPPPRLS